MNLLRPKSIQGWLITRLTVAQCLVLTLVLCLDAAVASAMLLSGSLFSGIYELGVNDALATSLSRNHDGRLILSPSADLVRLRSEDPDFWFVVRDREGQMLTEGTPPPEVAAFLPDLPRILQARLGALTGTPEPAAAIVRWADTDAGLVQLVTDGGGRLTAWQTAKVLFRSPTRLTFLIVAIAVAVLLLVTPFVVRRALKGLARVGDEAAGIDIDRTGARLSTDGVPIEILPFVHTVNDALQRLDKGYEARQRFLADAAHELRTPIAILTTRLSSLPSGPERTRLLADAARLAALADQLLDLQRLEQHPAFSSVDLVRLAERVVLDLAPLAFGSGYQMAFEPEAADVVIDGDARAVERALTNLVQNAINYGGGQGTITVRVTRSGWIEVADEGAGVPEPEREHVFEPFRRLRQDGRGVGLGLDLVRRTMGLHGGRVEIVPTADRGACFRLAFPLPADAPAT